MNNGLLLIIYLSFLYVSGHFFEETGKKQWISGMSGTSGDIYSAFSQHRTVRAP